MDRFLALINKLGIACTGSSVGIVFIIIVLLISAYSHVYVLFTLLVIILPKCIRDKMAGVIQFIAKLIDRLGVMKSKHRSLLPPPHPQVQLKPQPQKQRVKSERGLANIGSTCYMNAAIQCLHKTFQFTISLQKNTKQWNTFVKEYLIVMKALSSQDRTPFKPTELKRLIGKYNSQFLGHQQQDSSELLMTVLNQITEQMEEVTIKKYPQIDSNITDDQALLKAFIHKDQMRSKSLLDDIFIGRFLTTYECSDCGHKQKLFEKFHLMHLPIPSKSHITLSDCMKEFCKSDVLKGDNAWFCNGKCQKDTETNKYMSVYQANKIMMICLKRFNYRGEKINDHVHFQQEITLKDISTNKQVQEYNYELYGVINHSGSSLNYGHYYSYCFDGESWREYNDGLVRNNPTILSSNAFVLFYRKKQK